MSDEITHDRKYAARHIARGCKKHSAGKGMLKIVILLDEETFAEVAGGAISNGCSFAAQARMLIEVALETLKIEADEARRAA